MTREQIEQAAKEYAVEKCKYTFVKCDTCPWRGEAYCKKDASISAFIAGAESRKAEIDELTADIERCKNDDSEGLVLAKISQKIISDKRAEIGLRNNELSIMHNCMSDLLERQYDDSNERGSRIQRCFRELEKYKKQSK